MVDGSITIDTRVDTTGVKTGLVKTEKAVSKATKKMNEFGNGVNYAARNSRAASKHIEKLGSSMKSLGAAVISALAIKGISEFGRRAVMLASDLEEVQNVVDSTFGDSAKLIDEWAKTAGEAFGLSELQAKQYTGTIGAMFQSMGLAQDETVEMSKALSGLAGDLASFYNIDIEEAFYKLRSGISGETEPLKQLGINLSQVNLEAQAASMGINKSWRELTEAEKATIRYNYILKATKTAQGDFARTSDGLANQLRILKLNFENVVAEVGEKFLPIVQDSVSAINGLIKGDVSPEEFGKRIAESFSSILRKLAEGLPRFVGIGIEIISGLAKGIAESLPELIPVIVDSILLIVDALIENLPLLIDAGIKLAEGLIQGVETALPALLERLPEILGALSEKIPQIIQMICDSIRDNLPAIQEFLSSIITQIVDIIPDIFKSMQETQTAVLDVLLEIAGDMIKRFFEALPRLILEEWPKFIISVIKGYIESVLNAWKVIWDVIKELFYSIPEFTHDLIKKIFSKTWEAMQQAFLNFRAKIIDFVQSIWNGILEIVDAIFGTSFHKEAPKVQSHHNGTFFANGSDDALKAASILAPGESKNYMWSMVKQGKTVPRTSTGTMYQPGNGYGGYSNSGGQSYPQGGGSAQTNVNIEFSGSMAQLARVLTPEITTEMGRSGPSMIGGAK